MGYRIKELREKRNMTQEELADKSGVCRATISGLENGMERATTIKTLSRLAEALEVTVDQLFFTKSV